MPIPAGSAAVADEPVVEAVGAAARAAVGQIGDDRALGALGEAVVQRVHQQQRHDLPGARLANAKPIYVSAYAAQPKDTTMPRE